MNRLAWTKATLAAAAVLVPVASVAVSGADARAGTSVVIGVGDGCCWGPEYPRHHYHRDYYYPPRRPIYVVPPPVIYEAPPPVVVYRPAPQVIVPLGRGVDAAPASADYVDGIGRTCREYQTSVVVGGVSQPAFGTACRQPDGVWRVVR